MTTIMYRIHLDDPHHALKRIFVREAGTWPFPWLPSPGDAVGIDSPGSWERVSGEGDTLVSRWVHEQLLQPRPINRAIFLPGQGTVHIDMEIPGLEADPESQIEILVRAGFREVTPDG
ncbi:hypothetical protein GCM10023107_70260 [Actinoplanes octamycinicus]|nr:hypothetical protein Aoc01nite_27150 [Actinoplanes octamycinicus]